jgi:glucosamine--fructose-6-phosphate aminotransferase (isomerizing)
VQQTPSILLEMREYNVCSIIGYLGEERAARLLVNGLRRMEYRGYDSAGVATVFDNQILVKKQAGKVDDVNRAIHLDALPGEVGVGHTRWATHGEVTNVNAHPQLSSSGAVAIVHNGIIDNYLELRQRLAQDGSTFRSQTDSEVIANLLEWNYNRSGEVKQALVQTVSELKGSYAFVALFENETLAAARFHQPLVIGIGKEGYFIASDVLGFLESTDKAIYLNDRDFVILNRDGLFFGDFDMRPVRHQIKRIAYEMAEAEKGEYAHHTLKEIFEQPATILRIGAKTRNETERALGLISQAKKVYITGSGTSFHAALIAKYLFSEHTRIDLEPIIASEVSLSPNRLGPGCVLIAVSQSGESADVLEAASLAMERGAKVVSIVNVMTSSLARMSSISIGLNCGPEIGIAATKSFSSQLALLYEMAERLGEGFVGLDLNDTSNQILKVLQDHSKIERLAQEIRSVSDVYVLGRGVHYPMAAEAALKLKELAYIHAEAIPGGELKHGPIALLDSKYHVIVLNPRDSTYTDTLTTALEAKARGAKIIGISNISSEVYDRWIELPSVHRDLYPFVELVQVQLLSYYLALLKNADPDHPRNLAKSVTVK